LIAEADDYSPDGCRQPTCSEYAAAERDAHIGPIEAVCLSPPPTLREAGTPVLLGVHLGVVERPRFVADACGASRGTAEHVRMPVLAEERHHREHATATEDARPQHRPRQRQVCASVFAKVEMDLSRRCCECTVSGGHEKLAWVRARVREHC
jgi:hypothetical protein